MVTISNECLNALLAVVDRDGPRRWAGGLHFGGGYVTATDGLRLLRVPYEGEFPETGWSYSVEYVHRVKPVRHWSEGEEEDKPDFFTEGDATFDIVDGKLFYNKAVHMPALCKFPPIEKVTDKPRGDAEIGFNPSLLSDVMDSLNTGWGVRLHPGETDADVIKVDILDRPELIFYIMPVRLS